LFWGIIMLALAMNMDCFAAGLAYSMAGIRLPVSSRLLMTAAMAATFALAMCLGGGLAELLPAAFSKYAAAFLLILLGLVLLWQARVGKNREAEAVVKKDPLIWQIRLPFFGVMIQVLRNPQEGDKNADKTISAWEAIPLGLALAVDSCGVGLAIGVGDFPVFWTVAVVAATEFLLLSLAVWLGNWLRSWEKPHQGKRLHLISAYLPAVIILCLGIWRLI